MNSILLLPIMRKSDRLKAIWWKQLFIKIFDLHFLVHRYVYGTKVDAAHSWQIDGKKIPGPPAVCVGCPWVEWHFKRTISEGEGRGRTSKERSHWWASQAWTQERRGKGGREGGKGEGWGEGKECGRELRKSEWETRGKDGDSEGLSSTHTSSNTSRRIKKAEMYAWCSTPQIFLWHAFDELCQILQVFLHL